MFANYYFRKLLRMNWTSLYDFEIAPILTQSLISRDLFHTQKELKDITEEIQLSITAAINGYQQVYM